MRKVILVPFIILAFLTGCATLQQQRIDPQPDVLSGNWEMIQWQNSENLETDFPRGVPGLELKSEGNEVTGFNGCNRLFGRFRFDRDAATIQFFALQTTKMFCLSVAENEFSRIMTLVNNYQVNEQNLYLMQNEEVVMVFQRKTTITDDQQ